MAVITDAEVQAWLEATKLTIAGFDTEFELTARLKVFGAVAEVYDTSTWVDHADTPELVSKVIAAYVAAWTYRRQYSEDADEAASYADWLEALADELLANIVSGTVDLAEVEGLPSSTGQPDFYPKDFNYDADTGLRIDEHVFTMAQKW